MMKDNILPEEKLLRLIRGSKKQDVSREERAIKGTVARHSRLTVQKSVYFWLGKCSSFLCMRNIRKIIWLVFAASCIYLTASFIYPYVGLKRIKLPQVSPQKINEQKIEPIPEVKPLELYSQGLKNRQIFSSLSGPEAQKPVSAATAELIKDINLVGVISGANPQAVVENKKTLKTYYLNKGQFLGEFQVEDIQDGKVILNYQGQKFELYL